jgi:PAS domain S-box-containing protein
MKNKLYDSGNKTVEKPKSAIFIYLRGYFFAIGLVVLATWLKHLAQPNIIPADVPILYILAIALTATFFGFGPSILCCFLSLAAFDFFFLPPLYTFSFNIEVVPISLIFLFVGVIISYLSSNLRKKTDEARKESAVRKQAEKAVLAERQQFNDVLETLPCYMILLSPDYHVVFANKFFRERFGESHGKRCFEFLFNRTEPCEICETYKVLKEMKPLEWEWLGPDNRNYYIYDFPFNNIDGSTLIMEVGIDITEQKQAQNALRKAHDELELRVQERTREYRETRDYLDNLFNYANAPIIVWNPDFEITRFNHAFERLTGRIANEMLGKKLDILFPDDGHDDSMSHIRNATSGKRWEVVEIPIKHKDGTVRILLWNSATLYAEDGKTVIATIAQGQDITERKKIEEDLRNSQNDLNRAQAVAHTGSWRLDVRQDRLFWSDETYHLFGIPPGTPMTYDKFLSSIYEEDRDVVNKKWQEALRGEPYDIEHRIVVGAEIKWVREKAELEFDKKGKLIGGFGTVQDITELKKIEKMKDEFIGLVSHELRTPMTVITGSLRTAMSEGLPLSEIRELIQNATEGADQLTAILENMLELSRYQAGRLKLRVEPVSIIATVRSVARKLKSQGINHQFTLNIPNDLPPVEADPVRVDRILYNLMENATKYSPAGSNIQVSAKTEQDFVVTAITDHGPGIPQGDRARLFEQFQQLEAPNRPTGGAGLGLVVCKRLVEAQGGWIKVDSVVGKGSTFSFALPQSKMSS